MTDTTTPVTPTTDDLQINLEEAPKTESQSSTGNLPSSSDENLDLTINLPEISKNDDRLKEEDQKNQQAETPAEIPVAEIPTTEKLQEIPEAKTTEETKIKPTIQEPETQPTPEIQKIPSTEEQQHSEVDEENIKPSSSIEEITTEQKENLPQGSNLEKDVAIINELEEHPVAGGLSSEATIPNIQTPIAEQQKTFNLDAMLGTPPPVPIPTTPQTVPLMEMPTTPMPLQKNTETPTSNIPTEQPGTGNLQPATTMIPPAFTIPTTTTQIPVSAVTQTTIPQKKATGVKILLFTILFAALGFTTFFILKTMYPVEFDQILRGNKTEQMHASEAVMEEMTKETMTGEYTGEEGTTGTTEGIDNFGELNELGETPQETREQQQEPSAQTDVSRLADYVNKGNELRETGKSINNTTIIKYGLYISKKATDLLEKIAKGEEIDNLSGYFAQFDQYIAQLEALLGTSTTPTTTETTTDEGSSSPSPTTNDLSGMTEPSEPTPNTNPLITE